MRFKVDCPLKIVKTLTPFQSSFCPPSLRGSERAVPSNVRKARLRFWAEWRGFLLFSQQGTSPPPEVLNTEQGRKIGLIVNDGWLYAWKLQEDPVPRVLTFQSHPSTENVSRKDNGHGLLFLVLKNFPLEKRPINVRRKIGDPFFSWNENVMMSMMNTFMERHQRRVAWEVLQVHGGHPCGRRTGKVVMVVHGSWIHVSRRW